ncbi:hypothetical protein DFH08DRAFT_815034 [Mycena albidolilacea]|uniref:Uncharacterized protein n=1 Tax=Mycena albidolilacea TaxID=1033008 RepID=A0AAD6ZNC5_9AGAR|nr:hypothetical protein DFH08DRAFT_815034 [Mycena albidolilacea]
MAFTGPETGTTVGLPHGATPYAPSAVAAGQLESSNPGSWKPMGVPLLSEKRVRKSYKKNLGVHTGIRLSASIGQDKGAGANSPAGLFASEDRKHYVRRRGQVNRVLLGDREIVPRADKNTIDVEGVFIVYSDDDRRGGRCLAGGRGIDPVGIRKREDGRRGRNGDLAPRLPTVVVERQLLVTSRDGDGSAPSRVGANGAGGTIALSDLDGYEQPGGIRGSFSVDRGNGEHVETRAQQDTETFGISKISACAHLTTINVKSEATVRGEGNIGLYWGFCKGRDEIFTEGSCSDRSVPCRYLVSTSPEVKVAAAADAEATARALEKLSRRHERLQGSGTWCTSPTMTCLPDRASVSLLVCPPSLPYLCPLLILLLSPTPFIIIL